MCIAKNHGESYIRYLPNFTNSYFVQTYSAVSCFVVLYSTNLKGRPSLPLYSGPWRISFLLRFYIQGTRVLPSNEFYFWDNVDVTLLLRAGYDESVAGMVLVTVYLIAQAQRPSIPSYVFLH